MKIIKKSNQKKSQIKRFFDFFFDVKIFHFFVNVPKQIFYH